MPVPHNDLEDALNKAFPQGTVEIEDLRGDDDHYAATITCSCFEGKSRIQQHRLVQEAVAHFDLHALAITTKKP